MTSIDRVGPPPLPARPGARAGATASPRFPPPPEPGSDAAAATGVATAEPVALASLLALQQVDEPTERDHAARRHGHALLRALGQLQRLLLEDSDPADALARIQGLVAAVPVAADAGLAAAVDQVVLRARIELARRGG